MERKEVIKLAIQASIAQGKIIITLDYDERGEISKSGKSRVHASTRGNATVTVNGKTLQVGVNVYSKS